MIRRICRTMRVPASHSLKPVGRDYQGPGSSLEDIKTMKVPASHSLKPVGRDYEGPGSD